MRQTTVTAHGAHLDDNFPEFAAHLRKTLNSFKPPFFSTNAQNLFATYLTGFPLETRQTYNCHACRRFIEQYGNLVSIDEQGNARSVLWGDNAPFEYRGAADRLKKLVEHSPVEGVFLDSAHAWGSADTFDAKRNVTWAHFIVDSPQRYKHALKTPFQAMAEHTEEYGMVQRGLAEFPREAVLKAKTLLETEQLYRGEKTLGVAKWLLALHDAVATTKNHQQRRNIIWRAVATAPAGFTHVKSTMIGTLLEDLAEDMPFETVKRRFAEKMHPLQYQRPSAPVSEGNIAQAEELMEKMGAAKALERRFARLEDLQTVWTPKHAPSSPSKTDSLFGHLRGTANQQSETIGSAVTMTWEKFARTVLPTAEQMDFSVPAHGAFIALVTAVHNDAPNIMQWDNPVSWYVYNGGSNARTFNLSPGWVKVNAVSELPCLWGEKPLKHQGEGVVLILDGARDVRHTASGGFFVENLKSEFHSIRRTLEAYMMRASIAGKEEASACGYDLRKGNPWNHFGGVTVRVTSGGVRTMYKLDRWD